MIDDEYVVRYGMFVSCVLCLLLLVVNLLSYVVLEISG